MHRLCNWFTCLACLGIFATAYAQDEPSEQLIVNIDRLGSMYVAAEDTGDRLDEETSRNQVAFILGENPSRPVVIRSDRQASSRSVAAVLAWLAESGAESIELATTGEQGGAP